jgi:hypothetical protein
VLVVKTHNDNVIGNLSVPRTRNNFASRFGAYCIEKKKNNYSSEDEKMKKYLVMVVILLSAAKVYPSWTDITISSDYQIGSDFQAIVVSINGAGPDAIKIDVNGGCIGTLKSNGVAEINMSAGSISNDFYTFHPGYPYYCPPEYNVYLNDTSKMTVKGGIIEGLINISDNSQMDVYGYSLHFTSTKLNFCHLYGYWQNGEQFNLTFVNNSFERVILHEIPEPASFIVFGLGLISLRRK